MIGTRRDYDFARDFPAKHRPENCRVFSGLVRVETRLETQMGIVTPVIHLRKSEIIQRGIELGAPLNRTWSC